MSSNVAFLLCLFEKMLSLSHLSFGSFGLILWSLNLGFFPPRDAVLWSKKKCWSKRLHREDYLSSSFSASYCVYSPSHAEFVKSKLERQQLTYVIFFLFRNWVASERIHFPADINCRNQNKGFPSFRRYNRSKTWQLASKPRLSPCQI